MAVHHFEMGLVAVTVVTDWTAATFAVGYVVYHGFLYDSLHL